MSLNLVTGAGGFIGGRLAKHLSEEEGQVRCLVRQPSGKSGEYFGDLLDRRSLATACAGVDTIFHCAGHAHAFSALGENETNHNWRINFDGTRNLVEAAGQAGIRRLVFLSSVKAMGEPGLVCVDEDFTGRPETAYGQAKRAAEEVVLEAGARYGMHVVNLRLAMVYGSGGRGNFERMGRLVRRGLFPPLPETGNRRSLVHVNDVVCAMRRVAGDERAGGQTYIIASQEAPSGRKLFDMLRDAQGMPPCYWALSEEVLRVAGRIGDVAERLFKRRMPLDSAVVSRLLDSAWYSPAKIRRELGWQAQVSLEDGLKEMLDV